MSKKLLAIATAAIFSIGIAAGSALASYIAHGRIVLKPTLIAAVLLGAFSLDLGWATFGRTPGPAPVGVPEMFTSFIGLRMAIDLAGLAVAGGLFIVPSFSAVQAWAGPDRRARVVAAVNVLNAAFMTVAGIVIGAMQIVGLKPPALVLLVGVLNLIVALIIHRTMPE